MKEATRQLILLWNTLKLQDPTDKKATMHAYLNSLSGLGLSIEAIASTVTKLCRAQIPDVSKTWCPEPARLSELVQQEQARLNRLSEPAPFKSLPKRNNWLDPRDAKREHLRDDGWSLTEENLSAEEFKRRNESNAWHGKHVKYVAILGEVWSK